MMPSMFCKVFTHILDSSIAENYEVRHFFEDLLKLADLDGTVDLTPEAIVRRINLPLEKVLFGLVELQKPDPKSRCADFGGRRIVLLDAHRDWGWRVVNFQHYRGIRDAEERRVYFRDAKRRQRAREKPTNGTPSPGELGYVKAVNDGGDAAGNEVLNRLEALSPNRASDKKAARYVGFGVHDEQLWSFEKWDDAIEQRSGDARCQRIDYWDGADWVESVDKDQS